MLPELIFPDVEQAFGAPALSQNMLIAALARGGAPVNALASQMGAPSMPSQNALSGSYARPTPAGSGAMDSSPPATAGGPAGMPAPGGRTITGVVDAGRGYTTVQYNDGTTERLTSVRADRNRNPHNIMHGSFTRRHGAVGDDGRFAVFPTVADGRRAAEALLFDSSGYRGMNIHDALYRWAPPTDHNGNFENHTDQYIQMVAGAVGLPSSTALSALTPAQRFTMLEKMARIEGYTGPYN